mmetsp:Transcript_38773/g.34466  ORF Transcript_38773/g.34466 Transcript_38773/m.34466 type:complete len:100 (+) Transcript_38773:2095-2394(+)
MSIRDLEKMVVDISYDKGKNFSIKALLTYMTLCNVVLPQEVQILDYQEKLMVNHEDGCVALDWFVEVPSFFDDYVELPQGDTLRDYCYNRSRCVKAFLF